MSQRDVFCCFYHTIVPMPVNYAELFYIWLYKELNKITLYAQYNIKSFKWCLSKIFIKYINITYISFLRWTYVDESETSGVAVIELILPTGYFVHKPDLDRYVYSRTVPRLRRGRVYPKSAVFMFDYVSFIFQPSILLNFSMCIRLIIQKLQAIPKV